MLQSEKGNPFTPFFLILFIILYKYFEQILFFIARDSIIEKIVTKPDA